MTFYFLWGENMNILLIGGDRRQAYIAEMLNNAGHKVEHYTKRSKLNNKFDKFDVIILPFPTTRDGTTVYNTLTEEKIFLKEIEVKITGQKVLCGNYMIENKNCTDYGKSDSLAILNAVPTAEGAIEIAIKNTDFTLWNSKCLIVGNGKIGKILADRLVGLKADVTVSARKDTDFAFLEADNIKHIETGKIKSHIKEFDIIFNTVYTPVIKKEELINCKKDCLLIELASAPYGIDIDAAKALNLKVIVAPGLPGKIAGYTAAKILFETIKKII